MSKYGWGLGGCLGVGRAKVMFGWCVRFCRPHTPRQCVKAIWHSDHIRTLFVVVWPTFDSCSFRFIVVLLLNSLLSLSYLNPPPSTYTSCNPSETALAFPIRRFGRTNLMPCASQWLAEYRSTSRQINAVMWRTSLYMDAQFLTSPSLFSQIPRRVTQSRVTSPSLNERPNTNINDHPSTCPPPLCANKSNFCPPLNCPILDVWWSSLRNHSVPPTTTTTTITWQTKKSSRKQKLWQSSTLGFF